MFTQGRRSRARWLAIFAVLANGIVLTVPSIAAGATIPAVSEQTMHNALAPATEPGCGGVDKLAPIAGFNPLTATATELKAADFPSSPSDPEGRQQWLKYVQTYLSGNATVTGNCAALQAKPVYVGNHSPKAGGQGWAGYGVDNGRIFTDVEATWIVGKASGGAAADSYHWVGLGAGYTKAQPLVQAGWAATGAGGLSTWIETYYPDDPIGIQPAGLTINQGDEIYLHVAFAANGSIGYHFIDYNTGINKYPTGQVYSGMAPDGHVEWITEKAGTSLANFGEVTFQQSYAGWAGSGWQALGSLAGLSSWVMRGVSNDILCSPSAVSSGTQFTNTWLAAQ